MAGFKTFEVNGRKYTVIPMPPDQVLSYGLKVAQVLSPVLSSLGKNINDGDGESAIRLICSTFATIDADKVTDICRTAITHTVNDKNEKFDNMAVYNSWFMQYPEDMFVVSAYSVWRLVEDFFPKLSGMQIQKS